MINSALGKVVDAVMIDENDHDYFVQPARNGQTYRLPKDESPQVLHIGGSVRGFVCSWWFSFSYAFILS